MASPDRADFAWDGQKAAFPKTASSAGSRVSPATSITATPTASGTPRSWYRPKLAKSKLSRANTTVAADTLIDSPTRARACATASLAGKPERSSSRER